MRVGVNGYSQATGPLPASSAPHRKRFGVPRQGAIVAALLLGLTGCSTLQMGQSSSASSPGTAAAIPAVPDDPLAAFAARANAGQEELVGNPPVRARMLRSYYSGGGRQCRELALGAASTATPAVYCESAPGVWTNVRPLLGTGQTGRS